MSKFTKGPWLIGPYDPRFVFGNDGGLVAEACRGDSTEDIANARLIAAAPLLYEALANLENDDGAIPPHAWQMVQAALDAAKDA